MNKMSFFEALHGILAFMLAKQSLAKDIQLEVTKQDG